MPIPTRSKLVRIASKAPQKASQHEEARTTAPADVKVDSRPQSRPSTLPQPQRQSSVASHHRSHSITMSGIPQPQGRSFATTLSQNAGTTRPLSLLARETHQGSASTVKPTFNTYQQHYSPQKLQALPRLAHNKVEPQDRSNANPKEDPYISQLQHELLQLSLVHQHSTRALLEFERSVNEKLVLSVHELAEEREVVSALEIEYQQRVNALALCDWLQGGSTIPKQRKVQDLSFCISELADLSGNGDLFNQLMVKFGQWLEKAQKMFATPSKDTVSLDSDDENMVSLETPEAPWRQGIDECSTRLRLCQTLLTGLGDAETDTGIGIVLGRHRQLAAVMLDKVRAAQDIMKTVTASQARSRSRALSTAVKEAAVVDANDERKGIWSTLERS